MVEDRWSACRESLEEMEVSGDGVNGGELEALVGKFDIHAMHLR